MNRSPELAGVKTYVSSEVFEADLAATRDVWSSPGVMEAAGSFVLLTYFSLPVLLAVQAPSADSLRVAVDGHRERQFLQDLAGLATNQRRNEGIGSPGVRDTMCRLRDNHLSFPGMTEEYMSAIASLLALAPMMVRSPSMPRPDPARVDRYWRYMATAMSLLGTELPSVGVASERCAAFVDRRAATSEIGCDLIRSFCLRHPVHVAGALPALRPSVRRVVQAARGLAEDGLWTSSA